MFPKSEFMGLTLSDTGADGLVRWLVDPDPATVAPRAASYLNAHTVNLAHRRGSTLRPALTEMDLLYPDGMSVVKEARRRGFAVSGRVSAADFFLRFCWAAAAKSRTIALIGGTPEVVTGCRDYLEKTVPQIRIVHCQDGFFDNAEEAMRELADLRPDITLVGMGSPRQEAFALQLRDTARLPTTWCVGALFEYHAPGARRHAPLWMRQNGLEWLFRLSQEPGRLAGRYLLGNVEFLMRARGATRR